MDEDSKAVGDYKERINELIRMTWEFRKIIFTCRTQFFPSEIEEPKDTGIMRFGGDKGTYQFGKIYLSPFDKNEIRKYLKKKYSIWSGKRSKGMKIIDKSVDLLMRPMLLSYIDDLIAAKSNVEYSHEVYSVLIEKWVKREASVFKNSKRLIYETELFAFSKRIALIIYDKFILGDEKGLFISPDQFRKIGSSYNIKLTDIEMKSRSLLNRNPNGEFKFSHKSILEYFVALELYENPKFLYDFNFNNFDQSISFYYNMCWSQHGRGFFHKNFRYRTENKFFNSVNKLKQECADKHTLDITHFTGIRVGRPGRQADVGYFLRRVELEKIKKISLNNMEIDDLRILANFKNIEWLDLSNNNIKDINLLRCFSKLNYISLDKNTDIVDLEPLLFLKSLRKISLIGNDAVRYHSSFQKLIDKGVSIIF